jgi:tetraspanin-13/31
MVAFLLIGVATYAKTSSIVVTLPVVGGIVACGVFLLFVAILGLIATVKHHQVMLFFYMMILFVIFVIQFSVACACIGFTEKQEQDLAKKAWDTAKKNNEMGLIHHLEVFFQCCGYDDADQQNLTTGEIIVCTDNIPACRSPTTASIATTASANSTSAGERRKREAPTECFTCKEFIDIKIDKGFNAVGGLGLFFALTELVILVITYRFRKQIQDSTQQIA